MTSTGEDTQPNTETIAPVRPPAEKLGPLGQINDPPGQKLNIQAASVKCRFRQADHSFRSNMRIPPHPRCARKS